MIKVVRFNVVGKTYLYVPLGFNIDARSGFI